MNVSQKDKVVVLVSGGLDSTTTLAIANQRGYEIHALTIDYGQKHKYEIECAKKIAEKFGVKSHTVFRLDLSQFGQSALTSQLLVPKDREISQMEEEIPVTYVPARNTVFLSVAMAFAESLQAHQILIGVNAVDYSGYPDCRPEFISAFEQLANLATKTGIEQSCTWQIHTPLIKLSKSEIISLGLSLGVDYSLTHTCYDPDSAGVACGRCDACLLRIKGFEDLGMTDPVNYNA